MIDGGGKGDEKVEVTVVAEATAAGETSHKREVPLTPSRLQYTDTNPKKQKTDAAAAPSNSPLRDDTVERTEFTQDLQQKVVKLSKSTFAGVSRVVNFLGTNEAFHRLMLDVMREMKKKESVLLFDDPCNEILDGAEVKCFRINVVAWPRANFFTTYGWVWIGNEGEDSIGSAVFVQRLPVLTETVKGKVKKEKGKGKGGW